MKSFMKPNIAFKVQFALQSFLLLLSIIVAVAFYNNERDANHQGEEEAIRTLADGVINGANMLMLNGIIGDPEQRKLFIRKMGSSEHVLSLRIIRNKLVQNSSAPVCPKNSPPTQLNCKPWMTEKYSSIAQAIHCMASCPIAQARIFAEPIAWAVTMFLRATIMVPRSSTWIFPPTMKNCPA